MPCSFRLLQQILFERRPFLSRFHPRIASRARSIVCDLTRQLRDLSEQWIFWHEMNWTARERLSFAAGSKQALESASARPLREDNTRNTVTTQIRNITESNRISLIAYH